MDLGLKLKVAEMWKWYVFSFGIFSQICFEMSLPQTAHMSVWNLTANPVV